jgi:Putative peptidoglycan binding domain
VKYLPLFGMGFLAASLLTGTPRADAHSDGGGGGGSTDSGHSDTSTHSGGGSSNSGSHSGHDGGSSHGNHDHGRFGDAQGYQFGAGSGPRHGGILPAVRDSHHWERHLFRSIVRPSFHVADSSGAGGRPLVPGLAHQAERSRGDSASRSNERDDRRDVIFHGNHYHRYYGAWVLIDDPCDPNGGSCLPPAPYDFDEDTDSPENQSSPADGPPDVIGIAVQTKLAHRGYYHGRIDGMMGSATRDAISAFQRDNGLRVTGYINTDLLEALKL